MEGEKRYEEDKNHRLEGSGKRNEERLGEVVLGSVHAESDVRIY